MNKETASLAQRWWIFSTDNPEDELNQEERSKIRAYLTESDRKAEPNVNDKLEERQMIRWFWWECSGEKFFRSRKGGFSRWTSYERWTEGDVDFDKEAEAELDKGKKAGNIDEEQDAKDAADAAAADANMKMMKNMNPTSEGDYQQTNMVQKQ